MFHHLIAHIIFRFGNVCQIPILGNPSAREKEKISRKWRQILQSAAKVKKLCPGRTGWRAKAALRLAGRGPRICYTGLQWPGD